MRRTTTTAAALAALLTVAACGTETGSPGGGYALPGSGDRTTSPGDDADQTTGAGADDDVALLPDTRGEAHFFIDSLAVRQAESDPVQLFLDVEGDAPTPCHDVAYQVETEDRTITVHLTTVERTGMMCTQVLVPHEVTVPLGEAESFPVTIDVNDGEHVLTVNG